MNLVPEDEGHSLISQDLMQMEGYDIFAPIEDLKGCSMASLMLEKHNSIRDKI